MSMEMLLNKRKKGTIITVMFFAVLFIGIFTVRHQNKYRFINGTWELGTNFVIPPIGYNSKYAGAEDLVGRKIIIYERWNRPVVEWESDDYVLGTIYDIDMGDMYDDYKLRSPNADTVVSFPIKELHFSNEGMERNMTVFIDQGKNIYIQFSDAIGDLAIYPLIESN